MYISSLWSLISLLIVGALSVGLGLPVQAWAVQCGDVLISAGTVVLDTDLTCPNPDEDYYAAGLKVLGDTTLDLNGHTISCTGGLRRGVRMDGAVLRNGTIANCEEGLSVGSKSVVENMVFTRNGQGVLVEGAEGVEGSGDNNVLRNNTAVDNLRGFGLIEGADDNIVMNNLATGNTEIGFGTGKGRRNQLIGNTASFNGVGFLLNSSEFFARANVAEENLGPGFEVRFGYGRLENNIATGNSGGGFILHDDDRPLHADENVAYDNGGDGFLLPASNSAFVVQRRVLRRNLVLNNSAHGIHVEGHPTPKSTMIDNTVLGHLTPFFDLADDNLRCRGTIWRKNIFATASQVCIH